MNMGKMLIDEYPLMVLPSLAVSIGLNEALVIQQVHYWIGKMGKRHDGRQWIYNTYEQWENQFPFWSNRTLRRIIANLEEKKLLITSDKYNKMPMDKTKWYTIDYEEVDKAKKNFFPCGQIDHMHSGAVLEDASSSKASGQSDHMHVDKMTIPCGQNDQATCGQIDHTNNHRLPETTTENTKDSLPDESGVDPEKELSKAEFTKLVIDHLNEKMGTNYRHTTKATQTAVSGRRADGYTLEDFYTVIDKKYHEWIGTDMESNLCPDTLFRPSKFEKYINQPWVDRKGEKENGGLPKYQGNTGRDYGGKNTKITKYDRVQENGEVKAESFDGLI